jgi:general secretion pathway protein A
MYKDFFGFSEEPFRLTPDPAFLFMAMSHWEALSSMMSGIKERKGLITITGDVGTGKTTLIQALLKDLSDQVRTAFIFNPHPLGIEGAGQGREHLNASLQVRRIYEGKIGRG